MFLEKGGDEDEDGEKSEQFIGTRDHQGKCQILAWMEDNRTFLGLPATQPMGKPVTLDLIIAPSPTVRPSVARMLRLGKLLVHNYNNIYVQSLSRSVVEGLPLMVLAVSTTS